MSLPKRIKILLVEDSKLDVELILIELERNGFSLEPTVVYDRAGLDAALCGQPFDLIPVSYTHLTLPTTPYV